MEISVGIICASIPSIKPLLSKNQRMKFRQTSAGSTGRYIRHGDNTNTSEHNGSVALQTTTKSVRMAFTKAEDGERTESVRPLNDNDSMDKEIRVDISNSNGAGIYHQHV